MVLNAFAFTIGFEIFLFLASVAIFRFHRSALPKSQFLVVVFAGVGMIGAPAANLALVSQRNAGVQERLDAARAHGADLRRRIDANVAAMQAFLAEPGTSQESPSFGRDQPWREALASLGHETAALSKERDALLAEINAIPGVAVADSNLELQRYLSLLSIVGICAYGGIVGLALLLAASERRAETRAAPMRLSRLEPRVASDRVDRSAASGEKLAAVGADTEWGADRVEAKNPGETLSGR
jgi:hypothetical protein